VKKIQFPEYSGIRCLMMPFVQGEPASVPPEFRKGYEEILRDTFLEKGEVGYLTIDESVVYAGNPHRGDRAKFNRALHTEAGRIPGHQYGWGGGGWGKSHTVTLDRDVEILLANNLDNSCAVWDAVHENTSIDGDIGHLSEDYPLSSAELMKAGEVRKIGILTPHESLPVLESFNRQFLRILGSGVHGREPYFTINPLFGY
jgi:hypothetical protein